MNLIGNVWSLFDKTFIRYIVTLADIKEKILDIWKNKLEHGENDICYNYYSYV